LDTQCGDGYLESMAAPAYNPDDESRQNVVLATQAGNKQHRPSVTKPE
jgi:hypothetical protein